MRPRHADVLKSMGCSADLEMFRATLAAVKAEMFPGWTDEALIVTKDQAGQYCAAVRKRLDAPRLTRSFILLALIGLRKNRRAHAAK